MKLEEAKLSPRAITDQSTSQEIQKIPSPILSKVDRAIQNLFQSKNSASIPFKVISYFAKKHLKILIPTVMEVVNKAYQDKVGMPLITSCLNTANTVAALFLGLEKGKATIKILHNNPIFGTKYTLPTSLICDLSFSNLFNGLFLCKLKEHDIDLEQFYSQDTNDIYSRIGKYLDNEFKSFLHTIDQEITGSFNTDTQQYEYIERLSRLKYENNSKVIAFLLNEILKKKSSINAQKSSIYCMSIMTRCNDNLLAIAAEHEFVLEQFLREEDQSVCYRFYQSWINETTIEQDLQKQSFREDGKNAWTQEKLLLFFEYLIELLSYQDSKGSYEKCFGYKQDTYEPTLLFKNNHFSGRTLRYISHEIDPRDCLNHIGEILKLNSDLEKSFLEELQEIY